MTPTPFVPDPTLRKRLLEHSVRDENGCLIWVGVENGRGYGLVKNGPKKSRRMVTAHRASFAVFVRPLEPGEHVLHTCDVTACIEPTHLFAGDHSTNMRDMISKGRRVNEVTPHQVGSSNSQTHLTESLVSEMRERRAAGALLRDLAEAYSVSKATVSEICSGRTWKHVA